MITRWEEIADRAADRLGLPKEDVRKAVAEMAKCTQNHAMHPLLMETDIFGIGYLTVKFNRIKPSTARLRRVRAIRERFMAACLERNTPKELEKAEEHKKTIALIDRDLLMLEEFTSLKNDIYRSYGRKRFTKATRDSLGGEYASKGLKKKYRMSNK